MRRREVLRAAGVAATAPLTAAFEWPFAERAPRPSLLIAGSSLLLPMMRTLAGSYARLRPALDLVIEGGGSGTGLIAVKRGAVDIAVMSRDLTASEDDLNTHNTLIGVDAVAAVVNPAAAIEQISPGRLRAIFNGGLPNWLALEGHDVPIEVCVAASSWEARASFDDLAMGGDDPPRRATICATPAAMRAALARNPAAIGYLPVRDLDPSVRALAIDYVALNTSTVLLGTYSLSRPCFLVQRGEPGKIAAEFVAYCVSTPAQSMLGEYGVAAVR